MIPAGDRVLGVAFGTNRERNAAMPATVGDGEDLAADAPKQDALAKQDFGADIGYGRPLSVADVGFGELGSKESRIPMITESKLGFEIGFPGSCPLGLG